MKKTRNYRMKFYEIRDQLILEESIFMIECDGIAKEIHNGVYGMEIETFIEGLEEDYNRVCIFKRYTKDGLGFEGLLYDTYMQPDIRKYLRKSF